MPFKFSLALNLIPDRELITRKTTPNEEDWLESRRVSEHGRIMTYPTWPIVLDRSHAIS